MRFLDSLYKIFDDLNRYQKDIFNIYYKNESRLISDDIYHYIMIRRMRIIIEYLILDLYGSY